MAYVTFDNRTSLDYRFTVTSLDDPAIAELKALIVRRNGFITRSRKLYREGKISSTFYANQKTQGLRIRPRGPRKNSWAYDTPTENATHFDVYVRDYS